MEKQKIIFVLSVLLLGSFLMMSGCTQQNPSDQNKPSVQTLRQIIAKADTNASVYYELEISTMISDELVHRSLIKIWQKTPYLKEVRSDTIGDNITRRTIIRTPDGVYINRSKNTQNKYEMVNLTDFNPPLQPFTGEVARDLLNNQTITTLGTETIDGKKTSIIQYIPIQTGNLTHMKIWIWNDKGFPLKAILTKDKNETIVTINYLYKNYLFAEIPDSTFNIPT